MIKYIIKRVLLMLFTFFIIISMCFFLVKLLPMPPVDSFGKDAALIEARRVALGYYEPLIKQYFIFIQRTLIGGDWGASESAQYLALNVVDVFMNRLPNTIYINVLSMIISVPVGLALGIFAALKKNRWQDHLISILVMLFISVPSYVYAFLVQYLFCFQWQIFPQFMVVPTTAAGYFSAETFVSVMPAVLSLSFGTIAGLTRYTRAELTEVLTSEFMLLARTKGLTRAQATTRHALRNAMVPIFPSIIGQFIGIISGSLIIENIFSIPGVGPLYVQSITQQTPDYNMFMLLTAFYCIIGLLAGIVVDISYGIIDPRIRMGAK